MKFLVTGSTGLVGTQVIKDLVEKIEGLSVVQLAELVTAPIAKEAFGNGGYLLFKTLEEAVNLCTQLAPEHLSLQGSDVEASAESFMRCGAALFIGSASAEVLGDYGMGPNHVLPTGGTARTQHGLWVGTFMNYTTWIDTRQTAGSVEFQALAEDVEAMARIEGLLGHANSIKLRRSADRD